MKEVVKKEKDEKKSKAINLTRSETWLGDDLDTAGRILKETVNEYLDDQKIINIQMIVSDTGLKRYWIYSIEEVGEALKQRVAELESAPESSGQGVCCGLGQIERTETQIKSRPNGGKQKGGVMNEFEREQNEKEKQGFLDEMMKKLPPDFRPGAGEIEAAYRIFGANQNGQRPHLRILVGTYDQSRNPDRTKSIMRIIIDNRLCLFFYGHSGKWIFDGYECGNYEGYWTEFDWLPIKDSQ